jgi:hypothetical protein
MLFITALCAALVATSLAQSPMARCAAQYEEVMGNLDTFLTAFMTAKEECTESPECAEVTAPVKECFKDVMKYKEQEKAMGMMKMNMLKNALDEIGEELLLDPSCDGSGKQYSDLSELLGEKHSYHLFEGKHCKMALMHSVFPKDTCKCVGECMMQKLLDNPALSDKMTVANFDAKLEFLEDPFSKPIPDAMKAYDLMAPALCVINACGYETVDRVVKRNPTMMAFKSMMGQMKKGMMMNKKMHKKMNGVCKCLTGLPGADSSFDCDSVPQLVGMKKLSGEAKREAMETCAAMKRQMVSDMKDYFVAVGGSK